MIMKYFLNLFILFFCSLSIAQVDNQYAAVDLVMNKIPADKTVSTADIASYIETNFKTDSDRIRGIFYWTASNISYDIANMNEPNYVYTPKEKIEYALKNRKGVCINYAEVFNEIANLLKIKTVIIGGYTKQFGKIATISHAWNASKIDGKWLFFDPTWGSGYVNNEKFFKKLNNNYFKVLPSKITQSHMPFDYLWQFSKNPITNNEFVTGSLDKNKKSINFDFESELEKYEALSAEEQAFQTSKRVEQNGVINALISDYLNNKKQEFLVVTQNKNIENLNQIIIDYNQSIALLNDFIQYRNKKFKPDFSDSVISEMIKMPFETLKKCQEDLNKLGSVGKENQSNLSNLRIQMSHNYKIAEEHNAFVREYLSKSKSQRKGMFSKTSFFGIPLR